MINGDMESLKNLMDNLSSYGKKLEELPFVLQYNKRDLRNVAPVAELDTALNFLRVPTFEAVAPNGKGVTETLVGISRMVFAHLRKTLLMPGEMAVHDDLGDLADAQIGKTFAAQEGEPLEEISDVEEIRERVDAAGGASHDAVVVEVDLDPTSLRSSEAPKPSGEFEELSEIEVEIPEKAAKPAPPSFTVSADDEKSGLTFLKFETPFIAPGGEAVLPALFIDPAGIPVRLRIRVRMDGE
jgi:hypothetical protein